VGAPGRDGQVLVERAGRRYPAEAVRVGGDCWVHVNGRAYLVQVSDATSPRVRSRAHVHDILAAPMPATVVRLDVAVGDEVAEGQVLLVLEAMKMQMPLKAPHRAVVRTIACAVGDLVPAQVALVELDELDN
jgi:biotin carboxyl carrier protein